MQKNTNTFDRSFWFYNLFWLNTRIFFQMRIVEVHFRGEYHFKEMQEPNHKLFLNKLTWFGGHNYCDLNSYHWCGSVKKSDKL